MPTVLTLARLIISPLILPLLLVRLLPFNVFWINGVLALIFVLFGLTDFLDGYLARKLKQESRLGGSLDHIADKFLVYSTLVALLAIGKIYYYWVVILIGRDFFMMGLRQLALESGFVVSVSLFGKLKTAVQMALLAVLIANPYQMLEISGAPFWNGLELVLLVATLMMSVISAYVYYLGFMAQFLPASRSMIIDE